MVEDIKPESIEASKLEWGPNLGLVSWNVAQEKIARLNAELSNGEKPWRLTTKAELITKVGTAGFRGYYWASDEIPNRPGDAFIHDMGYGGDNVDDKITGEYFARCVR